MMRRLPTVDRPHQFKSFLVQDADGVAGTGFLDWSPLAVDFEFAPDALAARRLAIALVHGIDPVEDLAVHRRAQQLEVLGMRPHQRYRRPCRLAYAEAETRPLGFVPHLLRHH